MSDVKPNPIINFIAKASCFWKPDSELCDAYFRYRLGGLKRKIQNIEGKVQKAGDGVQRLRDELQKARDEFQKARDEFQKIRDEFQKIKYKLDPKKRLEEISSIRFHQARNFQVLSFPRGRGF